MAVLALVSLENHASDAYRLSKFLSDEAQAEIAQRLIRLRIGLPLLDLQALLAACPEIVLEVSFTIIIHHPDLYSSSQSLAQFSFEQNFKKHRADERPAFK